MNSLLHKLYTLAGYETFSALICRNAVESSLAMLPALGQPAFAPLPGDCAAPFLWEQDGETWLFCEQPEEGHVCVAVSRLPCTEPPKVILKTYADLCSPVLVRWNDVLYMLLVSGESVAIYRCLEFPERWELAQRFTPGEVPESVVVLSQTPESLTLVTSAHRADDPQQARYRRCQLCPAGEEDAGEFLWVEDETFNLQNRNYSAEHNGGALFDYGGQIVRPVRVENGEDPCHLQFYCGSVRGPNTKEVPMCAATVYNLLLQDLPVKRLTGVTGYARSQNWELLAVEYLKKM